MRAAALVAKRLEGRAALLAGSALPDGLGAAECEPIADGADFDCAFQGDGMEPTWFRIRLQDDGSLTKWLGERRPVAGAKDSSQTEALLLFDDRLQRGSTRPRDYSCSPSPRRELDGRRASGGATGQLCSTQDRGGQRYVELAADGTARRDYVLAR